MYAMSTEPARNPAFARFMAHILANIRIIKQLIQLLYGNIKLHDRGHLLLYAKSQMIAIRIFIMYICNPLTEPYERICHYVCSILCCNISIMH